MRNAKWLVPVLLVLIAGCGGGGGGNNGGGGGISGHVPYLLSTPTVSYKLSTYSTSTAYDVTITLQASGPTGVYDVSLWILGISPNTDTQPLTLINTSTNTWSASTNSFLPLPPGQYEIDSIELNDGDPIFFTTKLRTGWYMIQPMFSNDIYFVDERETLKSPLSIIYYNYGLSGITVKRFTLP